MHSAILQFQRRTILTKEKLKRVLGYLLDEPIDNSCQKRSVKAGFARSPRGIARKSDAVIHPVRRPRPIRTVMYGQVEEKMSKVLLKYPNGSPRVYARTWTAGSARC